MRESSPAFENFEDAFFRLFLDRVATVEGERLLRKNEELRRDPAAAVPEDAQARCLQAIRRGLARRRRKTAGRTARMVARALLLAAIIALLTGLVAFAAFPTFRAGVLNLLLQINGDQIDWEYVYSSKAQSQELDPQAVSFEIDLPDSFVLDAFSQNALYEKADYHDREDPERTLQISIARGEDMRVSSDIEDVDYYEEFLVQGAHSAVLTQKNGYFFLVWSDKDVPCFISLTATNLSIAEVKALAETVHVTR